MKTNFTTDKRLILMDECETKIIILDCKAGENIDISRELEEAIYDHVSTCNTLDIVDSGTLCEGFGELEFEVDIVEAPDHNDEIEEHTETFILKEFTN